MNFMPDKVFVDTNILIYAHDLDAGAKHEKAARLLETIWDSETGVLSIQVLQEFYVNVTRKIAQPLTPSIARGIVENYLAWHVETLPPTSLLEASEISERYLLSFWDALIVTAARRAKVQKIVTEDLNHGQTIDGIQIVNPFKG
jgi:predicted nucleic acid-binding protein